MTCRKGFTLVEMVCVVGLMSLIAGLVSATLTRNQRLSRSVSETLDVRRAVRDGAAILAEEIRGASAADTVRLLTDSAIELFTNLGSSVVCGAPGPSDVGLAPLGSDASLTSWLTVPDTGDIALIYRTASTTAAVWERYRIRAVVSRTVSAACNGGSGFGVGGTSSYVVTLLPAPPPATPGQPVRFIRRGRYSLYKSSDAKWYLGYRRCNAMGISICGSIQPVSGYYQPYSSDTSRTGLLLRYYDASGRVLSGASGTSVARVQITARAVSANPVTTDGVAKSSRDSSSISVALRNHP